MGLDVYLCYYPSLELREKEIEYLKRDDELWKELTSGDFNTLSEKEKWERTSSYGDRLCAIATELGLGTVVDQDLGEGHKRVLLDSAHYPDHSFKIGYYRSGYFGGFNSVTNAAIGKTLYWIFEPKEEELKLDSMIQVDWERAQYRAKLFLAELVEAFEKGVENVHAESDYWNIKMGNDPTSQPRTPNEWYLQAAEIIIETIEYVLASDTPRNYYLEWAS